MTAWNRHPLGNRASLSIWREGIRNAVLHPSNADDFIVGDGLTSYGVDPLGPTNHFDLGNVVVPSVDVHLSDGQMRIIQE